MPVLKRPITHDRERGRKRIKKSRFFHYSLLICSLLIMSTSHNAYNLHKCLQQLRDNDCDASVDPDTDEVGTIIITTLKKHSVKTKMAPPGNTRLPTEEVVETLDSKGEVDADPTKQTKNINNHGNVSPITRQILRELAISKAEASKALDDHTYEVTVDPGAVTTI